ncbi:MAG TPA: hypothetical protein VNG13_07645 [Mycobacteriales bacterium]|nr:hypothetical protein [Mycobacteriales bacterium]
MNGLPVLDPTVAAAIDRWRPWSLPEPAITFARSVVAAAGPPSAERARNLLWATGKLAAFGVSVGLCCEPEVLLHPSVIERFAVAGCATASPAARRTWRTNLRFVASRVGPPSAPPPARLPREKAQVPYTSADIAGYLGLADAQPTLARRMRLSALICLGAGAGLIGADLRGITGADVHPRSGGVVVDVRGRRPRAVPVRANYHDRLLAAAAFAGTASLIGGVNETRRNLTTPLVSSLSGGLDLPRLHAGRLRATWLTDAAAGLGLSAFMTAAGIVCSQRLGDLLATLPPVDEASAVVLLGGTRR